MKWISKLKKKKINKTNEQTMTEIDLSRLSRFTTYHHQKALTSEQYERIKKMIDELE